ncbi:hypothetical protein B0H14DRAFT_1309827 [Mycena olivaceomarginata]|nr:hypothetical protein B0H14DRAFT_1309827 [Mycena olivaceomarginata]
MVAGRRTGLISVKQQNRQENIRTRRHAHKTPTFPLASACRSWSQTLKYPGTLFYYCKATRQQRSIMTTRQLNFGFSQHPPPWSGNVRELANHASSSALCRCYMLRPSSSTRRKGALRTEAPPRLPHNQISTPKNPGHKKRDAVPPVPIVKHLHG